MIELSEQIGIQDIKKGDKKEEEQEDSKGEMTLELKKIRKDQKKSPPTMKIDKEIGLTDMIVKIGLSVIELERDMTMGIESETTEEEIDNKNGLVQDR